MKKSRKFERAISVISLFLSLFMMYGIGYNQGESKKLIIISIFLGISAVISAGLLE